MFLIVESKKWKGVTVLDDLEKICNLHYKYVKSYALSLCLNETLAEEMLGFQKGNPKHRFVIADNDNTALVLKSKYGLSLYD